jgi:hypothetical protein
MLNPMDFYLWLSEEIQTFNWDSKTFGTRFGLAANFIFLVARANAGGTRDAVDDVFGDAPANGWFTLVVSGLLDAHLFGAWLMFATRLGQLPPMDADHHFYSQRILHHDTIAALPSF